MIAVRPVVSVSHERAILFTPTGSARERCMVMMVDIGHWQV